MRIDIANIFEATKKNLKKIGASYRVKCSKYMTSSKLRPFGGQLSE